MISRREVQLRGQRNSQVQFESEETPFAYLAKFVCLIYVRPVDIMPISESDVAKKKLIGSRIIELESHNPGLVRMRANPAQVHLAAGELKKLGFKKPFLQSDQQFLFNCVLSYQQAISGFLPFTLLAGPDHGDGHIHCWNGYGHYIGWQGLLQLFNFASGGKDRMLLIMEIQTYFDKISDLLQPIPRSTI